MRAALPPCSGFRRAGQQSPQRSIAVSTSLNVSAVRRHFKDVGQLLCPKPDLLQFVGEDFSRVNECARHHFLSFVVIQNFYVRWTGPLFGN